MVADSSRFRYCGSIFGTSRTSPTWSGRARQHLARRAHRPRPRWSRPVWVKRSERTNVLRLRTLRALRDVELDLLVLVEGLVALRLDRGVVNEDVVAAVLLSDEAETLLGVEPLDGALSHAVFLLLPKAWNRHFGGPARCG